MGNRTAVFFCDIMGTITSDIDRENKLKEMVHNLKIIKKENDIDTLYFSFLTSDNISVLRKYSDEFLNYVDEEIILGKQIFGNGYYTNEGIVFTNPNVTKTDQMLSEIKQKKPQMIFFADDNSSIRYYIDMISNILKYNVILFSPNERNHSNYNGNIGNLEGLNIALTEYIKSIKKKHLINKINH